MKPGPNDLAVPETVQFMEDLQKRLLKMQEQALKEEANQYDGATLVIIGKKGQGKSTLCNSFLLGDSDKQIFKVSQYQDKYTTRATQVSEGTVMNEGKIKVRVVDTPGTYKDNEAERRLS